MRLKDETVRCEFHWHLTNFLMVVVEAYYRELGGEGVITSGSETTAHHSPTSLHYAMPGCAADLRSWTVGDRAAQQQSADLTELADAYCVEYDLTPLTIEVVFEDDHHHVEFQPKRPE